MSLPIFYEQDITTATSMFELSELTAKHAFQVLRLQAKDQIALTDGRGYLHTCVILSATKKTGTVNIINSSFTEAPTQNIVLAVSLLKNQSRIEWLIEKATEIGIQKIIPLICERTEKQHFKIERFKQIIVSAMLQSKQTWLPELSLPVSSKTFFYSKTLPGLKIIAHCNTGSKKHIHELAKPDAFTIAIGPEGDFTLNETQLAIENDFEPVHLGSNRLRTETAALTSIICLAKL